MKLDRFIRVALAVVILLVFIIATGALMFISESALNVWDRLKAGPPALLYAYVSFMLLLAVGCDDKDQSYLTKYYDSPGQYDDEGRVHWLTIMPMFGSARR